MKKGVVLSSQQKGKEPIPVAILGATGAVGQKLITMVQQHPSFELGELAASKQSQGRLYREASPWREEVPLSPDLEKKLSTMTVCSPSQVKSPFALSSLPSPEAQEIEPLLASQGIHVLSNASALRMDPQVPLLIPEINRDHIELIKKQKTPGKIVTNPNCAAVFICLAIAPLRELGCLQHVSLTTLQGVSGAGYNGVSSMDILGNIIPYIDNEEDKIEEETKKILGTLGAPGRFYYDCPCKPGSCSPRPHYFPPPLL